MLGDQTRAEALLAEVLAKTPTAEPALTMAVFYKMQSGRTRRCHRHHAESACGGARRTSGTTANLGELYIRDGQPQKALDLAQARKAADVELRSRSTV